VRGLFVPILVIHVVVAVLGMGSLLSVAIVASTARRRAGTSADAVTWLRPLLRYSAFSLAAMLVTGILMDVVIAGAFHQRWWFRGSVLLLVATGAMTGQARRMLRRSQTAADERDALLRRTQGLAYGMCALVAVITVLMEVRPF
jgi:hypothetical protein